MLRNSAVPLEGYAARPDACLAYAIFNILFSFRVFERSLNFFQQAVRRAGFGQRCAAADHFRRQGKCAVMATTGMCLVLSSCLSVWTA